MVDEAPLEEEEYPPYLEEYLEEYSGVYAIVREVLPFEILAIAGGVAAGIVLSGMTSEIERIPGLLILVPAVLGMRGNITSALGSRLGTAVHMGLITRIERNPELVNNIYASLLLSLVFSIVLGVLAHYVSVLSGVQDTSILVLITISVLASMLSGFVLIAVAVTFSILSFRHGIDPDSAVSPTMATIGDIVAMAMIFLAARVVLGL